MIEQATDADGIRHVVWNNPDGPVNVKSPAAVAAFVEAVRAALADPAVRGILVRSAKRDFVAGGDLRSLHAARTPEDALRQVEAIGAALRRMELGGKPVVALLNGTALGGGLEIALACHRRIAVDDPRLRLGCPEVTLGLIPGAGATQRLPRLIGIAPAARLLLEGRPVGAEEALAIGLVDELVPADQLVDAGRAWILSVPSTQQPWDRRDFRYRDFHPQSREGRWFFFNSWPQLRRRTPADDLAPGTLLHVMAQGLERDIDAGLAIEARYFGLVAASRSAKNRIRMQFIAPAAARKAASVDEVETPAHRVGVVGAGLMGTGIALVCARAGLPTVLVDTDAERAATGLRRIAKLLDGSVERGQASAADRDAILARIETAGQVEALAGCDVVIEAIVESADAKSTLFRRIEAVTASSALLASNTSTLSIDVLARALRQPERFIGMHYFAPVDRMALVEVIKGPRTSDAALARTLRFLKDLGKTTIVVNDAPGFYTSRVVGAYTREALAMLAEGVSPTLVDNAAMAAGLPIGPLAMADLTSHDLLAHILASVASAGRGTARDSAQALHAVRALVAAGRTGRKTGAGIYDYPATGRARWAGLEALFSPLAEQPDAAEVARRLLHIQSIEAVHAIEEGVIADALQVDLGAVLGWSYPAFRGGVLAHVDDVGAAEFVRQCEQLASLYGERFRPPETLRAMARSGSRFHAQ